MKTIYLECAMGASGDMLTAALLELHPNPEAVLEKLNALKLPGVSIAASKVKKCGITGTSVSVKIDGQSEETPSTKSHHTGLDEIFKILEHSQFPEQVIQDAKAVYQLLADVESIVHGIPVTQVHFHEVGMLDAMMDVLAVSFLIRELSPDQILASPIRVGSGQISCQHGVLTVPAPAVTELLKGIPIYAGTIPGECCTPTGAALLRYFVTEFCSLPQMKLTQVGYGMGKKDFPAANCLRAFLGKSDGTESDVVELRCNLDDMTPEAIGFAMEVLLENGALDIYTTPIGMKKCRPGTLLTCLCFPHQKEAMTALLFRHTTTLGVRSIFCKREVLERYERTVETKAGPVRIKYSTGAGITRKKAEYDDLTRIAREQGLSLAEATNMAMEESWEQS